MHGGDEVDAPVSLDDLVDQGRRNRSVFQIVLVHRERQVTERLLAPWHLGIVNWVAGGEHRCTHVMETLGDGRANADRARHTGY
ncbi:MAG: hypothetical protein ACI8RE_002483 [Ilumatobacter sp.]